ncbi:MAG: diacylglycerol kinase family protein [Chloroflexota bacterium]|nr:diacylglycerol kinase family protein [Chloroflexota bacterium]
MARRPKPNLSCSFRYAWEGLCYVIKSERNMRIHLMIAIGVLFLSAWLRLSSIEWAIIVVAIALAFAGEVLNTAMELTIDLVVTDSNAMAKWAKDAAAATVLVTALASATLGLLILGPRLWQKLMTIP